VLAGDGRLPKSGSGASGGEGGRLRGAGDAEIVFVDGGFELVCA